MTLAEFKQQQQHQHVSSIDNPACGAFLAAAKAQNMQSLCKCSTSLFSPTWPARPTKIKSTFAVFVATLPLCFSCVPSGSAPSYDGGVAEKRVPSTIQSPDTLKAVYEDFFDRPNVEPPEQPSSSFGLDSSASPLKLPDGSDDSSPSLSAGDGSSKTKEARKDSALFSSFVADSSLAQKSDSAFFAKESGLSSVDSGPSINSASSQASLASNVSAAGPDWYALSPVWKIENGKLCGQGAKNQGIWLKKVLPINARIEFDAMSDSADGDLKVEVWGDGKTGAKGASYTNASSYLIIYGGWKNTLHAIARLNEHGSDRKEIKVDKQADDPRQNPVAAAQFYHFKIERNDGKTVKWYVDGELYLTYEDSFPLSGRGHDYFGFNNWMAHVCFDNLKITPL